MSFALDKDDSNIPTLIRDGWILQPDGSWLSADKKSRFLRTESGARMMITDAPEPRTRLRLARPTACGFPVAEGIICGEPENRHTSENAKKDVALDHDFIAATWDATEP